MKSAALENKYNLAKVLVRFEALDALKVSLNEYLVADAINQFCSNPSSLVQGWFYMDSKTIAPFGKAVRLSRATTYRALRRLKSLGLIQFHPEAKNFVRCTSKWYQIVVGSFNHDETTNLKMRQNISKINTPSSPPSLTLSSPLLSPENTTPSELEGTQKRPSCPLLNGSPLKSKYPNGHTECFEHLKSVEDERGERFINRPKQFNHLHKILRAGYGFDKIDRTIRQIEKKNGKGSWDYATVASWLEKGSAHAQAQ
jgi:hypothetical protein